MECPHCNQEHPEDTIYCPYTGKKMSLNSSNLDIVQSTPNILLEKMESQKSLVDGFLELKQQFYPLSTRKKSPTEYGSIENEVASKLFGIWGNRPSKIKVPRNDMIGFVLYFVCECPEQEWDKLKCPYSLLTAEQVTAPKNMFIIDFAILGEDVALIASSLMHWYICGGIEVFHVLRREWTFNIEDSYLERKGFFSILID